MTPLSYCKKDYEEDSCDGPQPMFAEKVLTQAAPGALGRAIHSFPVKSVIHGECGTDDPDNEKGVEDENWTHDGARLFFVIGFAGGLVGMLTGFCAVWLWFTLAFDDLNADQFQWAGGDHTCWVD